MSLIINQKPVILSFKASISKAIAQLTASNQTYGVVVRDLTGSPPTLGIVTETAILKAISTPKCSRAIADITDFNQLIRREIPQNPSHIIKLLHQHQASHLIVIDSERNPVGVINEFELLQHLYRLPAIPLPDGGDLNRTNEVKINHPNITQISITQISQKIIETTPNLISIYNLATASTLYINSKVETILGYDLKQIANLNLIHPSDRPRLDRHLSQCQNLIDGETLEIEYQTQHLDGRWIWLSNRHTVFTRDMAGNVLELLSIAQEITPRKQIEAAVQEHNLQLEMQVRNRTKAISHINQELLAEISERKLATVALRESEAKFRHIFEDSPIGIGLLGLDGKYIQVNSAFCQMLGYSELELKKLSLFEITHLQSISTEKDLMQKIRQGSLNRYHLEKSYIKKMQFQTLYASHTAAAIRDSLGNVRYFINMIEDISDRTIAAEELSQSEERFRKIFEESPIGIAILGLDRRVLKINAVLSQMLGYSEAELIERTFNFLTRPSDQESSDRLAQCLYQGQIASYQLEQHCIKKNQQTIWVTLNASGVKDRQGQLSHVFMMIQDITEQKKTQQAIANSLAEKEILLQEIHHRVKNNLHVIASLLELQARSTHDEHTINLFTDSQNRIHAMALIHEQLCLSSKFEHINFEQYLKNLVKNLFSSYGINPQKIKCVFDVEPISIRFETGIPCGLIFNEIISNSLKYAFVRDGCGEIHIQLHQQSERLNLVISDNGIGMPPQFDWDRVSSLGLRLVKILTKQLDGTIKLDRSYGTKFSFSFAEVNNHKEYAHA